MELLYTDGSPFARIVRVLVALWALPVRPREVGFPLPPEVDAQTPMGQVPLLLGAGAPPVFPTLNIVEHLAPLAAAGLPFSYGPADRAPFVIALSAGDAIAQAAYLNWAGLGPVAPNRLGLDLLARNLERFDTTVRWLAERVEVESVPGLAIAAFLGWAQARGVGGVDLGHPATAPFRALLSRPEVAATAPRPLQP